MENKDENKWLNPEDGTNCPVIKEDPRKRNSSKSDEKQNADSDNSKDVSSKIEAETIFIWVDILGFSSLVDSTSKYEELSGLLVEFYKDFKGMKSPAECQRISDGIILKLNPSVRNPEDVKNFFLNVMNVQNQFVMKKRYLRGGIAIGSKFIVPDNKDGQNTNNQKTNDSLYISNGLSRAYNLESTLVTWPIIGTNAGYLKKMCSIYGKEIRKFFSKTYSETKETIYYLNSYKILNKNDQESVYKNALAVIATMEKNPRVQHKYVWICQNLEKSNKRLTRIRCTICQKKKKHLCQ